MAKAETARDHRSLPLSLKALNTLR